MLRQATKKKATEGTFSDIKHCATSFYIDVKIAKLYSGELLLLINQEPRGTIRSQPDNQNVGQ